MVKGWNLTYPVISFTRILAAKNSYFRVPIPAMQNPDPNMQPYQTALTARSCKSGGTDIWVASVVFLCSDRSTVHKFGDPLTDLGTHSVRQSIVL